MVRQSMESKKALNVFLTFIVCSTLCGCSSVKNFIGFFNFWDSDRPTVGLSSENGGSASFEVRAPRRNVEAYYNLGCYYQERDRHGEAIEEFQKVVSIDPTNVKALNRMGISYDEIRDFPRAVACYEAAIKADVNADYTYNNLAHSYRLQGRFQESVDTFKKALAINGQSSRIHNNLGLVYTMMGQHELATKEFERAIALAKPATPIEQAKDRQEPSAPHKIAVKETPKAAEDPFTQAGFVQPNSTPITHAKKAPVETSVTQMKPQSVVAAVKTRVDVKTPVKAIPVASVSQAPAKAQAVKAAEVQKAAQSKEIVKTAKTTEITRVQASKTTTGADKTVEVKKAAEVKKVVMLKKAIEIKKVTVTSATTKNRSVSQAKPMNLVLTGKTAMAGVKPQSVDSANPERFYASLARSIVRATPENLVPKRMVRSDRHVMNVNLLIRKDMMPSTKLLLEDYS